MTKNSNYKILGQLVRKERKLLKLTQTELGDLSKVGLNFISQLERGKSTVRLDKLLDVLNVLGLGLEIKKGKNTISLDKRLL